MRYAVNCMEPKVRKDPFGDINLDETQFHLKSETGIAIVSDTPALPFKIDIKESTFSVRSLKFLLG